MKLSKNSIGIKLWKYFAMLSMVTLALLWLLQTVFLQSFYDWMQLENMKRAAGEIAENMEKEGDYHIVDRIAYENSMQVILTDMDGNILCRVDEYSPTYAQEQESQEEETKKQSWQIGKYRNLPKGYASFLQGLLESPGGYVSFTPATEIGGSHLVYGKLIHCGDKTVALYMNTPMGAVQPTVKILRTILFAVTGLLLFVGFILAFFFAKRFTKPVLAICAQAGKLTGAGEDAAFEKGFCAELDALSDSLDAAAKSLSRLEKSRRELLANITHDLKTPLTLIGGYAEKIEDLSWKNKEECQSDAAVIKREAKRLTLLVNDILDYSVLQSNCAAFDFQPVHLSELAQKVSFQFRVVCERQGILMERRIEPGLMAMADEQRISQVFYNLIANAITHVGEDQVVGVLAYRKEQNVRVEIYDHGQGIPKADIPYIWDRYFTSRERRRSEHGTGLGLSIVKEILNAHASRYGVISENRAGACFWFELKIQ